MKIPSLASVTSGYGRGVPDAIFAHPRLAPVYDTFDGPRDDLAAYVSIAGDLGAHRILDVGCGTGCLAILLAGTGRTVVAVLAAYPGPKDESAGGEPSEIGQLTGYQDGMAQRQLVHAKVDRQRGMKHRQHRSLDEPVEPHAAAEADVVAAADVVDACVLGLRQERAGRLRTLLQQAERREHADPD
jgi:SAM-dependent methyltransferase